MIVAGFQAIKFSDMKSIWSVGGMARWAMILTFVATLVTSIPVAVAVGVLATMVVFVYQAAQATEVHEFVQEPGGRIRVGDAPTELRAGDVTVVDVYGPLYFAAARTLRERLPDPASAQDAALVVRVRGNGQIGPTFIEELNGYATDLREHGGRLYVCGMTPEVAERMKRAGRLDLDEGVRLVPGEEYLGSSVDESVRLARADLAEGH